MSKLIIRPRQTGKTTFLVNEFIKDPKGIFITVHSEQIRDIAVRLNARGGQSVETAVKQSHVITPSEFTRMLMYGGECSGHTYYIDEYCFLPIATKLLLFNLHMLHPLNIVAISTPNKQYSRTAVATVRKWWTWQQARKHADILMSELDMVNKYGEDLMYNLLVVPNMELDLGRDTEQLHKILSDEGYKTEVLGQIFKETT